MRRFAPFFLIATPLAAAPAFQDPPEAPMPADWDALIAHCVDALLGMQEDLDLGEKKSLDGEPANRAEWPYQGVYRVGGEIPIGYRVGGTAIGAWALIDAPELAQRADVSEAVARATRFILAALDDERMSAGFKGGYDVRGWGHIYALHFFLRMRQLEMVPTELGSDVDRRVRWLIGTLQGTEIVETGGWNYARRGGEDKQSPASPFMTAPTILALWEARAQGEQIDADVIERALDVLEQARNDAGAIPYTTAGGRDEMPGAIGRTPVTEVVLSMAGRSNPARIEAAVEAFFTHWEELEKRRQKTGTHIAPYGVAPYYFFYAHYYVALAIEFLPEDQRPEARRRLLERLFSVRDTDGTWNDRVFSRSANFGTAMALLAIIEPTRERPRGATAASEAK